MASQPRASPLPRLQQAVAAPPANPEDFGCLDSGSICRLGSGTSELGATKHLKCSGKRFTSATFHDISSVGTTLWCPRAETDRSPFRCVELWSGQRFSVKLCNYFACLRCRFWHQHVETKWNWSFLPSSASTTWRCTLNSRVTNLCGWKTHATGVQKWPYGHASPEFPGTLGMPQRDG